MLVIDNRVASPAGHSVPLWPNAPMDDSTATSGDFAASGGAARVAALVGEIARGERSAMDELYRRTSAKLYGIAVRLLGSEAEAQEVVQDVYLNLWRKAGLFDAGRASPITWLSVMTRNRAIDRLRRRRGDPAGLEEAAELPDGAASAFDIAADAQDRDRLRGCLDTLDERSRTLIRSAFMDGLTHSELATRESVPLGTLKSWIRRGLQKLRSCLEQ